MWRDVNVSDVEVDVSNFGFDDDALGDAVVDRSWNFDVRKRVMDESQQTTTTIFSRSITADNCVTREERRSNSRCQLGFLKTSYFHPACHKEIGEFDSRGPETITVPGYNTDRRRWGRGTRAGMRMDVADEEEEEERRKGEEEMETGKSIHF